MKNAIIMHGMPSKEEYFDPANKSESNHHWLPWIQRQLILNGVLAQTPEMPAPYQPSYKDWEKVFGQFDLNEETILIGHSMGAGFLVRWLSENNSTVGKVMLVAPWIDPNGQEKDLVGDFFDFDIDANLVERTKGVTVFYSTDDDKEILDTVKILEDKVKNISIKKFTDKGHFVFSSMKTEAFPELLEEVLK